MSRWIEVSLLVDGEAAEAIAELLQRYGHQGVSVEVAHIEPDKWDDGDAIPADSLIVKAYFPDDERATTVKTQLETALGHMSLMYPMPKPQYSLIHEDDWAEAWKTHYHPLRIGQRILIRPRWVEMTPNPNDVEIALDPGMAFGTGTHPTTQLCLEGIEAYLQAGYRVLDLGCGSGILAIAAAKFGASDVLALDIEPLAVAITKENAAENGVQHKITAQEGSLESVVTSARRFDMIVVNILAKIIIAMCDQHLGDTVRPGGVALFSGIIAEQAEEVEAALRRTGLVPTERRQQGDWVLIIAKRPSA